MTESARLIKRLDGRNTTGLVEIHGQALFHPGADVAQWQRSLTATVLQLAAVYAPSNKRVRWAHSGPRLKSTMRASSLKIKPSAGGGSIRSAVGSTAPHSMYVDQGTGIFGAGNGPYQAKILPPWTRGSPSLYESTWRPSPGRPPVGTITVKGQPARYFFDRALEEGLRRKGMATAVVPGSLGESSDLYTTLLGGAPTFSGSGGFYTELAMWRKWRDEAWSRKASLGEGAALQRSIAVRLQERDRKAKNMAARAEIREMFRKDTKRRKRREREARNAADRAKSLRKEAPKKSAAEKTANQRERAKVASLKYMVRWQKQERAAAMQQKRPMRTIDSPPQSWGFWVKYPDGSRRKAFYGDTRVVDLWAEAGVQYRPADKYKG